ncbi:DNA polymerase alpha catalytic subunit-like [Palaemon carinicauda]|uniref:DNA polymerase alpha catalytic subunit-like n=1 Tax=Palaemon carinicauda TaxID=392227 RepID=UPI0035B5EC00
MDSNAENGQTSDESIAASRSRRTRKDKHGRLAALERLRGLKGSKHKYEVNDVMNVYEEVDEREYSKRRQDRLEDDWIVDDDGSGYVEDGREIFDEEDADGDAIFLSKSKDKKGAKKKGGSKSLEGSSVRHGSGSIKNMLINMPAKKKKVEANVRLDDDDVLGDILQDLDKEPAHVPVPQPTFLKKKPKSSPASKMAVNPFARPQIATPVRPKASPKPLKAPVQGKENVVNGASPKAKRSLGVRDEPLSERIDEYDSMDLMDGAFDDDMDDMGASLIKEDIDEEKVATNQVKEPTTIKTEEIDLNMKNEESNQEQDSEVNRGFKVRPKEEEKILTGGWETAKGCLNETVVKDIQIDSSQLPLTTNSKGEQVLRFYWLDAYEEPFKQPGTVYLFGKVWIDSVQSYTSCCISVKKIERRVYLLPRVKRLNLKTHQETDNINLGDVYNEFASNITEKFSILEFKSRKTKKFYAFEKFEVPNESDYLEIRYSADFPALPMDLSGETFSHVFGTNTSSLELFLLERQIKGPCWLDVKLPQLPSPSVSWCKVEAVAVDPEYVTPVANIAAPPIVMMTLGMRTTVNPKTHQNEIAMVSCLVHQEFPLDKASPNPPFQMHFCAMTHPSDVIWPWDLKDNLPRYHSTKIEKTDSERALLGFLLAKIHKIDPDVIVGHDIFSFDLSVLLHRVHLNKIPHWSRLGRLKRTQMPKLTSKGFAERAAMCGRLVCDLKISAKELIRAKSYDLPSLVSHVLKVPENECVSLTYEEVKKMYDSSATLLQLVTMTMQDASYVLRLVCELNVLPLALQITNIAGNVLSRTLLGGRSERNEFLLLHAFTGKDFIVPDRQPAGGNQKAAVNEDVEDGEEAGGKRSGKGRRKPAYTGGLVLDPKKGFYDKFILLMDFNSLYPSIIQEYNICFTTMPRIPLEDEENEVAIPYVPEEGTEPGVLPTEIRKLVESRKQVKQMMKQPDLSRDLKLQYDIRQKALKLTANSMYGCLGFSHSRFFARHLASFVTGKGREILLNTRDLVQKMNFEVIYGDTDSIMINTNSTDYDQVFKLGNKIKAEVNKLYKLLELDVDGVFKYMLLLKKKKYAALTVSKLPNGQIITEQELKGLDIVRRDWSQLASDCGKHIVEQILSDQDPDERIEGIHSHLESIKKNLEAGKVSLDTLAITKQLTKNPEDYPDMKNLPHVQVALRMNSRGGKKLRQGDTVAYVICEDGSNLAPTQRAYHVEEVKSNSSLSVDKKYYLAHQIHPVVSRLCDPIEGTDAARIAECLGLDPSGYRVSKQYGQAEDEEDVSSSLISDEERYRLCERFSFKCPSSNCDTVITMDSPFLGVVSRTKCLTLLLAWKGMY